MTNENERTRDPWVQITARLAVLECLTSATLALYIANSRNDPTFELAHAMLNAIRFDAIQGMTALSSEVQNEGREYLDSLIERITKSIPILRARNPLNTH